ncbi:LysR family transcriptional regulator [Vibrio diazotrophicus]|uniref:LysR family transcriptional regulator n=1 Tax=Vibrio diazotrophicus TaxID=685 RepID=UPI0005A70F65|nr:LysR family transcriptional regulator [Vibrio diazotrophicus]
MHKNYRYFLMVAHLGSIKQAAEQLHISQPSLTSAMQKLESDIGVSLFYRRSKGMDLTEYGKMLKEHVQQQQEQHNQLLHRLHDMHQREAGKLKSGTGDTWWELFVRDAVRQHLEQVPKSSIELEFGNNLSLMHHLVQGEIDLFVGHEIRHLHERCRVQFVPLLQDREAVYVRGDHPLLTRNVQSISEVDASYPLIRVTPDHARHSVVLADHMKSQMDISSDVGRSTYNVDSFSASLDILRSSDAMMPYSSKLSAWMMQKGFKTLFIDENKIGNVGIYHKLGCDDEKVLSMIERIRHRV